MPTIGIGGIPPPCIGGTPTAANELPGEACMGCMACCCACIMAVIFFS